MGKGRRSEISCALGEDWKLKEQEALFSTDEGKQLLWQKAVQQQKTYAGKVL